jgi:hypothetical protein
MEINCQNLSLYCENKKRIKINLEIIIHRVNKISQLKEIPSSYGVEVDIRAFGSKLILNHEPFESGDSLENYLAEYDKGTIVLNIKEAGIENEVLRLVRETQVQSYFLLDVEYPYILQNDPSDGLLDIAVRFSEQETIQNVFCQQGRLKWVWIDCVTRNPVEQAHIPVLSNFKSCLVCPSRWGRPKDITQFRSFFEKNMTVNAVMTEMKYSEDWMA